MRLLGTLLASLLLLSACELVEAPGSEADLDDGFLLVDERGPVGDLSFGGSGDDDDDEPDGDPIDDDDDDEPEVWDVSPPAELGTAIEGTITCGWLTAPLTVIFHYDGAAWQEEHTDSGGVGPRPELLPCFGAPAEPEFDHRLHWDDDGSMFFQAGGLDHDLTPTATEMLWLGPVGPTGGPDAGCRDALQAAGIESPMIMSFRIESVTTAS